jgi:Zn-dependent protease
MIRSIQEIIYSIPAILLAFTFHSYAKARMADKLGDRTPRMQGRLNLNPLTHIDPIGTLLILIFGIGWAKPVETDPRAYKNFYKDDLKVSLAGPLATLGVAFVASIVLAILNIIAFKFNIVGTIMFVIIQMTQYVIITNVSLFIFYLLPLPGLDGFNIFRDLSPKNFYKYAEPMLRNQFLILIAIILFAGPIIRIPASLILNVLNWFIHLIVTIVL